ncbi:1,4-dihydroxy-2-naphthoate octaprenyltransferase [Actinomycetes bacterium]|nr:1,4-dihydroxy-2-naphthoate octaprenyltransferase [Actinomycetes bacterium]
MDTTADETLDYMAQNTSSQPSGFKAWVVGARPRTLPAAVVPVAVGAACAVGSDAVWWRAACALIVSMALQVGVNYANDYSDGIRGTDDQRVGPLRLVASGTKSAQQVKRAAFLALGVAIVVGLLLAIVVSWWLIVVGLCAVTAAWTYTGGPRPYGYAGLGEVFVFLFFGVVATLGTTYVLTGQASGGAWWTSLLASIGVGCFACALLVVNNLRDIPGDTVASKRTMAVRIGDARTRTMFVVLFVVVLLIVFLVALRTSPWALLGTIGVAASIPAITSVRNGALGRDLVAVLGVVGRAQIIFAVSFAGGIALAL